MGTRVPAFLQKHKCHMYEGEHQNLVGHYVHQLFCRAFPVIVCFHGHFSSLRTNENLCPVADRLAKPIGEPNIFVSNSAKGCNTKSKKPASLGGGLIVEGSPVRFNLVHLLLPHVAKVPQPGPFKSLVWPQTSHHRSVFQTVEPNYLNL